MLRPWLVCGGRGEALEPALLCCGFKNKKARLRISSALRGKRVTIRRGLSIFYILNFKMQLHSRENVVWEGGHRAKAALHQGS